MSGTGISQGSISAFGSIFVNGVRWDLSTATIEVDGVVVSGRLRVGMVVRVEAADAGNRRAPPLGSIRGRSRGADRKRTSRDGAGQIGAFRTSVRR